MTSDSIFTTLSHVWQALERAKIDGALMGGLAVTAWGYFRATRDVDLLIAVDVADWSEAERRLVTAGFQMSRVRAPKRLDKLHVVKTECRLPEVLWELEVDFLLAESPYHRQAIARSVVFTFPNMSTSIRVLTCEDVILHKLDAGRMLDLADCVELLRTNSTTIDNAYLDRVAVELGASAALDEVRKRAATNEALD
ncbi:MAG: hypothetical protein SGJ19_27830 [Planctomycetia bacterium]|nr:hypothetical protein [Planctomycetia bacterium]